LPSIVGSLQSWNDLLSEAGLMAAIAAPDGRILLANRALRQACGWTGEDDMPRFWIGDCIAGDDGAALAAFAGWQSGDAVPTSIEAALVHATGGRAPAVKWHGLTIRDEQAGQAAVAIIGIDMSAEHAKEASLRRVSRFYRALSDMNAALGRLQDATELYHAACDIAVESGEARMAWVGLLEGDTLVPVACTPVAHEYLQGIRFQLEAGDGGRGPSITALASGRPSVCNDIENDPFMAPWRDRARLFGARASGAFPILLEGRPVGTLNLYFPDPHAFDEQLTDLALRMASDLGIALAQLNREKARAQAERLASDRELQLAGLVDSALDGIIAIDRGQRIVLFNAAAARIFGVPASDAIGGSLDRFLPPGSREHHRHFVDRYAAEGATSRHMGYARELVGLRADGEIFPIEASISRSGEGEHMLMTVMVRDISQLRLAEREQAARIEAEAASRAKTEFLSRMSHELRTPLNAILGFSHLLNTDQREPLASRHREQLELILQAGSHLRALIDEMLDVAAIEAGRVAVDKRDFELCGLLDGVLRMSAPHAAQCGVHLQPLYASEAPLTVHSDPARLRQVVLNLVSNGIKYNRPGGHVRVGVEQRAGGVEIVVSDDGLGMSERQLAQLYQPFNRLGREAGAIPGTGIGLVLVRQLVLLLGGTISVQSVSGEGTGVRVALPASARPAPSPPAGQSATSGSSPDASALTGDVLYVEDNAVNALLVEHLLWRWPGVRVTTAPDGRSGIAQALAIRPAVVLLDMQLPDMTGLDVLRRLRSEPATSAIPVVALSASALPVEVEAAIDAGAVDYWTKPIDVDVFVAGMARLLRSAIDEGDGY
jgi:PAS domain S-box-containing protein